jgi:Spy/CpxP family protein refolding chaperone
MIKSLTSLSLATVFASALMFAQTTTGTPTHTPPTPAQVAAHRVQFLTTLLSLTSDQQAQATTIFTTAATANATTRTSLKAAHTALKTAIQNNDTAGINQAASQIGNLEGQSTLAQATADAAFYAILTADQKTKFSSLGADGHFGGGFGPAFRRGH